MDTNCQSLVREQQEEMFADDDLQGAELLIPEEQQAKQFTAEQVACNQKRYRGIVEALGQGLSVRTICRVFEASHHTVKRIRELESELVATEKQRMSRLLGHGIRLSVEGVIADLVHGVRHVNEKGNIEYRPVPTNVKAIVTGIFSDKKAMLDGEATAIIRHESGKLPSLEDMKRAIEALPSTKILEIPGSPESQSGEKMEETP